MRSTTGFQKDSFPESPPIGSPKYTKGIVPRRQFITEAASDSQESEIFTPVNILLLKFTFNPETSSNKSSTARIVRTFNQLLVPRSKVSSANCKITFYIICKRLPVVSIAPVADFMYLYLHKQIYIYVYERIDMTKF